MPNYTGNRRIIQEIYLDMLKRLIINQKGIKKTNLMFSLNTNSKLIKDYLSNLLKEDYVREWKGRYFITEKGINFFIKLSQSLSLLEYIFKDLEELKKEVDDELEPN